MIAKGASIAHGFEAINYVLNKQDALPLQFNKIFEKTAEQIVYSAQNIMESFRESWQKQKGKKAGRAVKNDVLRFEISPSKEELEQLKTLQDWQQLLKNFMANFLFMHSKKLGVFIRKLIAMVELFFLQFYFKEHPKIMPEQSSDSNPNELPF